MTRSAAEARAARLARLYPRAWRARFPDFEAMLAAELAEGGRGATRGVLTGALGERLRSVGVIPAVPRRTGLALVYAAVLPFTALTFGLWSQLHTGLAGRHGPASPVFGFTAVVLAVAGVGMALLVPAGLVLLVVRQVRDRDRRPLPVRPALILAGSLVALTLAGWAADRSGWYSPAAHALPAGGAAHVATLWVRAVVAAITPAWVHPSLFARMPAGQVAAAFIGPAGALVAAGAIFGLVSGLPGVGRGRSEFVAGTVPVLAMVTTVAGAVRWAMTHPAAPESATLSASHTGGAVVAVLVLLAGTALLGLRRVPRRAPG